MTTEPDTLTCSRCGVVATWLMIDHDIGPVHHVLQGCIDALRTEIATLRAPREVTDAQRDVIAEAYWSWRRSRVMVTAPEWMNLAPGGMQKDCYELADAVVAALAANTEPT